MKNIQALTHATWELGDWFRRLGGSNRYFNMRESEIFLFVACRALDHATESDMVSRLVDTRFVEAGKGSIERADKMILKMAGSREEIEANILEYVEYYDSLISEKKCNDERTPQWLELKNRVGSARL